MQQTPEMQILAQIKWMTRNSWLFFKPRPFAQLGNQVREYRCVRKKGRGDWIAKLRTQFSTRLDRTLAKW
jgi:hypothetical protein